MTRTIIAAALVLLPSIAMASGAVATRQACAEPDRLVTDLTHACESRGPSYVYTPPGAIAICGIGGEPCMPRKSPYRWSRCVYPYWWSTHQRHHHHCYWIYEP